jgi:anti-anti-sigma factor
MSAVAVIKLAGELEIGRKDEILSALQLAGNESGILVDFSEVTYADSSTLSALLRFRANTTAYDVPVAVLIGSRQFARLIQYAGLGDAFEIFEDRSKALTYLAETARA